MRIGLIGLRGAGKSTLFEWLTGVAPDPALQHTTQTAMAEVPDDRLPPLCDIYHPKKITKAALELVDTPGLSRTHEGNAARLSLIREAGCLVQVVAAYDADHDPLQDLSGLQDDFLLADMEIVAGRVERLREATRKPRPNRDEQLAELALIEPIHEHLESGRRLSEFALNDEQRKAIRSFCLLTEKPLLAIFNVADDETDLGQFARHSNDKCQVVAVPLRLEAELARMDPEEQAAFRGEMGLTAVDRGQLLRTIMDASGQMLFFTAGEKEVRTWMIRKGGTALEAADGIHSDLARGFIRAETISCSDLIQWGSEREIKARNLLRQEPKDYVIQDGDIINVRFSV